MNHLTFAAWVPCSTPFFVQCNSAADARRLVCLSEYKPLCFNALDADCFPHLAVQLAVAVGTPVVAPSWLIACGEAGGMVSACLHPYPAAFAASAMGIKHSICLVDCSAHSPWSSQVVARRPH